MNDYDKVKTALWLAQTRIAELEHDRIELVGFRALYSGAQDRIKQLEASQSLMQEAFQQRNERIAELEAQLLDTQRWLLEFAKRDYDEHGCELPTSVKPGFSDDYEAEVNIITAAREAVAKAGKEGV